MLHRYNLMILWKHAPTFVLMLLLSSGWSRAENLTSAFEAANKLYEQGKHSEAAANYEKLIQTGWVSAALYFNLGNALFKSGQIGRAIAAYRQAEQLAPRDPDVRANLQFARNQAQGPTLSPSRWQRWRGRLSVNEWTLLAASGVWLLLFLLAAGQWRPALKPLLRNYTVAVAVTAGLACACLGEAIYESRFAPLAIVIARNAVARHGPLEESQTAFTAHDGGELRVLDEKDDWLQVTTDPRHIGWLRREQVVLAPGI